MKPWSPYTKLNRTILLLMFLPNFIITGYFTGSTYSLYIMAILFCYTLFLYTDLILKITKDNKCCIKYLYIVLIIILTNSITTVLFKVNNPNYYPLVNGVFVLLSLIIALWFSKIIYNNSSSIIDTYYINIERE